MLRYKWLLSLLLLLQLPAIQRISAATPAQIYNACMKKVEGAKSLRAGFNLASGGHSAAGTLLTKGTKFAVTMPGLGTWYDGKAMWSYSNANRETTVWTPSKTELAESNPMLYISMASGFDAKAQAGGKGQTVVLLTPKRRNAGVKSVKIIINNATSLPEKLVITTGAQTSTITITSLSLNPPLADSEFTYPKKKYPKVPITDLR
ncbi:MAG: outer membrane lipoprotein carrier protein LolA [Muribaculaceae bacterium]|nr:outer membrane lipoprotein carrier protein LolA [Muribaculaceae bacterium]MDE6558417.1 outer membrane lipoprotein carrier protein LolA [Muribaculaceae bacterium]